LGQILGITNRGKRREITKWDSFRDYKTGQKYYKLGQELQIGAREITNRCRDYKSRQERLQIGAGLQIGAVHWQGVLFICVLQINCSGPTRKLKLDKLPGAK